MYPDWFNTIDNKIVFEQSCKRCGSAYSLIGEGKGKHIAKFECKECGAFNGMPTILGLDNGLAGALSFYDGAELLVYDMPTFKTDRPQLDLLRLADIIRINKPDHAYIEKLTPLPKISGLTAFSMGNSEGAVIATLTALQVPFTLVRPADWKKAMQCPKDKDGARMRACQLLPQFSHNWDRKKDDGRAESAIIALYGYKKQAGN